MLLQYKKRSQYIIQKMMRAEQSQRMPCRYGKTCKFLLTNNCHYYHPPQYESNQNSRTHLNFHPNQHRQGHRRNISKGKNQGYFPPIDNQHYNSPNFMTKGNNSYGGKMQDDVGRRLCKNFHFGIPCKYGDRCQKRHEFLYNNDQGLRRLQHRRDIPQNIVSRLTKIDYQQKEIFALRLGNEMFLFQYQLENNQMLGIGQALSFPNINIKYEYYDQKENYVYYSSQNETTKFTDIGFQNIFTKESVWIPNSHTNKLTGIIHYDQDTLISSSVEGDIKIWSKSQEGYIFNKEMTQILLQSYNPQKNVIQILFLNVVTIDGVKIVTAGTNDGRILFWSGNNFDFMEILLKQSYTKVYKIKLIKLNGLLISVVLAWNASNTFSAVLLVNLQTGDTITVRAEESGDSISKNMHLIQCIQEYIFICNIRGEVSIYNMKQINKKIGTIFHQNTISDIICSQIVMKMTGVRLKLIYILQKKSTENEGSFSIYLMQ